MAERAGHIFFWTRHDMHGFLSNFFRAPILIGSVEWPTSEHYYQANKTLVVDERDMVRRCPTPKEAKFAGYHVTLRADWDEVKEAYMLEGLRAKFSQYSYLRWNLVNGTGDKPLHEDSPWDKYWGYAGGKGQDRLGILLMQVREELRNG